MARASSYGLAMLFLGDPRAAVAAEFLDRVVEHFAEAGRSVRRVPTDRGSEFAGAFDHACRDLRAVAFGGGVRRHGGPRGTLGLHERLRPGAVAYTNGATETIYDVHTDQLDTPRMLTDASQVRCGGRSTRPHLQRPPPGAVL
jgi:hypothetical protein